MKFPQEESGSLRNLSRPWHGPYHVTSVDLPDITVTKVYHWLELASAKEWPFSLLEQVVVAIGQLPR